MFCDFPLIFASFGADINCLQDAKCHLQHNVLIKKNVQLSVLNSLVRDILLSFSSFVASDFET